MHHGTNRAATIAPKFEPLLKMPVAKRSFALGKPLGDRLDGGGKIARFAHGKRAADEHVRRQQPSDEGIDDPEDRPEDERERQTQLGPDLINDPAHAEGHAGVKRREEGGQIGEVGVGPAETAGVLRRAEKFLQIADDLPVHVIEGGGEEQQSADDPAIIARQPGCGLTRRNSCLMKIAKIKPDIQAVEIQLYKPGAFCDAGSMNLKRFLPLLPALLLTGCSTTFTRLTPLEQPRNANNLYPVEVQFNTTQQSLRMDSLKPYVLVNGELYPLRAEADGAEPMGGFRARAGGGQNGRLPLQVRLPLQ